MLLAFQNMLLLSMLWIKRWLVTELVREDLKAHLMRGWKWWQPRKISYVLSCMICTASLLRRRHSCAQSKIPFILTSHFFSAKRYKKDVTVYSETKLDHNFNYLFANCYFFLTLTKLVMEGLIENPILFQEDASSHLNLILPSCHPMWILGNLQELWVAVTCFCKQITNYQMLVVMIGKWITTTWK